MKCWAQRLEAWCELTRAAALIRISAGRPRLLKAALEARPGRLDAILAEQLVQAVVWSAQHHLKWMGCLERSLALLWMLRRRGVYALLRLGCRRHDGQLFFHAWVIDAQARPIGPRDELEAFVPLQPAWNPERLADWNVVGKFNAPAANPQAAATEEFELLDEDDGTPLLRLHVARLVGRLAATRFAHGTWRDVIRWTAPYALGPQGHITLHGSAVGRDGQSFAFVGFGGAGKSTMARELAARGWQPLADDMVVCNRAGQLNAAGEQVLRRWIDTYADKVDIATPIDFTQLGQALAVEAEQEWWPLAGIFFLEDTRQDRDDFALRRLSGPEAFHRLVDAGFGSLPDTTAWKHQFTVFGELARLPCHVLWAPDGLERMRAALPGLEENLADQARIL
ncbi:MAG: lasso peptide biosynthesis B2 protein [Gemmataceae bacterium]